MCIKKNKCLVTRKISQGRQESGFKVTFCRIPCNNFCIHD